MDKHTKEQRRINMRAVKSSGSEIETLLMKALWHKGYRYKKNDKSVYGTPDIVFKKLKIAVFCDSEFWHGKDWEIKKYEIKSRRDFWFPKIEQNIRRDQHVNCKLKEQGWEIIRFWGKDIKNDLNTCVNKIVSKIEKAKRYGSDY